MTRLLSCGVFAALFSISLPSLADSACAAQVARLLVEGKTAELARLFVDPKVATPAALAALTEGLAPLRSPSQAHLPWTGGHSRRSLLAPGPANGVRFEGAWIQLTSRDNKPLQLEVAMEFGKSCSLLAIHLDLRQP